MPAVLDLKFEDVDTNEKRSKYTVGIIGCGQKGILYADAFAQAGFKVICTDADQTLVKKLGKGKSPFCDPDSEKRLRTYLNSDQLCTSSELKKAVAQSDIIVVTVNVKINDKKVPDYSELESICKQSGASLRQGSLFIYGGIGGLGSIEGLIKETLENTSGLKVGQDFGLAYNPLQVAKTQPAKTIVNLQLTVAALEKTSLESASTILRTISNNVKQVSDVKTLELATLFNIAKQDANTALANEIAVFCESAGMDYFNVLKLVDTNGSNFYPTIIDSENKNEAYLIENAENLNTKLRLPALSQQINEDMVKHAVNLTQDALRNGGKTLRRARVAVFGVANPQTATEVFIKSVINKGAKITLYDPLLPKSDVSDSTWVLKRSMNEAVEGTDCIVILSEHDQFKRLNLKKLRAIMKAPAVLVDLVGLFEPEKVETEGFIYRGLGRGKGRT